MRNLGLTTSIVPRGGDQDVYIVEDDLDRLGRVWRGAASDTADFETIIADLLAGQYKNPIRVVAFNVVAGWSRDTSSEVAHELRRRCDEQMRDVPFFLHEFTDRYEGRFHDVQLPLPMRLF